MNFLCPEEQPTHRRPSSTQQQIGGQPKEPMIIDDWSMVGWVIRVWAAEPSFIVPVGRIDGSSEQAREDANLSFPLQ